MEPSCSHNRLLVFLMVLLSGASYFQRTIVSIAGIEIGHEFSLSLTQMGAIYSAFVLGYALAMIPAGWIVDWLGPRVTLTGFAAGAALFTAVTALPHLRLLGSLSHVFAAFLIIRFCLGIVTAPLYPAAGKMNAIWIPLSRRTQTQGWIIAGAGIGGALAPALLTRIIPALGWRASFFWTGVATAILGAYWHFATLDKSSSHMELTFAPATAQSASLFRNRNLQLLTLGYSALGYFEYLFFYWFFYYFRQVQHMDTHDTTLYTTCLWIAWMVMCPLGGFASDCATTHWGQRIGRRIVPIGALTLSTVCLTVAMNLHTAQEAGTAIVISMGLGAFADASFWSAMIEISGDHAGAAGGILNTGSNVGGFIAPVLTPWIASKFGWTAGIYVGCMIAALGILVWPFVNTAPFAPPRIEYK